MTARSTARATWLAVTVTCLVAAISYAGAVTTNALAAGVLTGVLGCAAVVRGVLHRQGVGVATVSGLAVAFGWAVVVNTWTGDTNGPAARSTMVAAGCTTLAVAAVATRWSAAFVLPVGGIVFGALALGAGGEVRVVALALVVAVVVTVAVVEHERRRWLARGTRWTSVGTLAVLVAAASLAVVLVQAHRDPASPRVLDPGAANATVHPTWSDPLADSAPVHRVDTRAQRSSLSPVKPQLKTRHHSRMWFWIVVVLLCLMALLLVVVGGLAARLGVVRLRWRRLRRTLADRRPGESVAGAWCWARLRLTACQLPLRVSAAPDLDVGSWAADLPEAVGAPLLKLSPHVAVCAFSAAPMADTDDATRAWRLADGAADAAFAALTRLGRWRARYRLPVETAGWGKINAVSSEARRG